MSLSLLENLRREHGKTLGDTFASDAFKSALNVALMEVVATEETKLSSPIKREASAAAHRVAGARDFAQRLTKLFSPPEPPVRRSTSNLNHTL